MLISVRDGGYFESCRVTINAGQLETYESDCVAPNTNYYTNIPNLQDVKLEWVVIWPYPDDIPTAESYIIQNRVGIIESYSQVKLYDERKTCLDIQIYVSIVAYSYVGFLVFFCRFLTMPLVTFLK